MELKRHFELCVGAILAEEGKGVIWVSRLDLPLALARLIY